MKALVVFGTRPEAIKLAPVLLELARSERIEPVVCVSGQHRELLDQVLAVFSITPDYDLDVMIPDQSPFHITRAILERIEPVLASERPDCVLVQGDAHTAFVGALAAYYERVPVAHVEAGLRTSDLYAPFPEEMNRRLIDRIAALHFAPTERAKANLLAEGIREETVFVTGNTEIDALYFVRDRPPRRASRSPVGSSSSPRTAGRASTAGLHGSAAPCASSHKRTKTSQSSTPSTPTPTCAESSLASFPTRSGSPSSTHRTIRRSSTSWRPRP